MSKTLIHWPRLTSCIKKTVSSIDFKCQGNVEMRNATKRVISFTWKKQNKRQQNVDEITPPPPPKKKFNNQIKNTRRNKSMFLHRRSVFAYKKNCLLFFFVGIKIYRFDKKTKQWNAFALYVCVCVCPMRKRWN